MSAWVIEIADEPVTLRDCPPGLFQYEGALGLKSEYFHDSTGSPDAYVVASGEYFWGGTSDRKVRDALFVWPVEAIRI